MEEKPILFATWSAACIELITWAFGSVTPTAYVGGLFHSTWEVAVIGHASMLHGQYAASAGGTALQLALASKSAEQRLANLMSVLLGNVTSPAFPQFHHSSAFTMLATSCAALPLRCDRLSAGGLTDTSEPGGDFDSTLHHPSASGDLNSTRNHPQRGWRP